MIDWRNPRCERCHEKREIEWVVFSDIIQDFVCDPCGRAALELRRETTIIALPGSIRVVPYRSERYAQ